MKYFNYTINILVQYTSIIGLEASTFFSTWVSVSEPLIVAKYLIAYFAETVFPAPDSPDTIMLWLLFSLKKKNNICT